MVSLIPEGLGGLDVSWGEEETVFVGHSYTLNAVFVP